MKRFLQSNRGMALLAIVGCALWGFSALFLRLRGLFADPLEDMSFGWLVPVFSLYVLWSDRENLRTALGAPSWCGLLACLPCALLAVLGTRGLQMRFEQLGFIGLCVTIPWAFCGRAMAKRFLFPALYLAFTIPLATFLDTVTIHLRLIACSTAIGVLRGFGFEVVQQGTALVAQGAHPFSIDVAQPCSGLRSIFALMALTAAYSWYNQPTWIRRGLLFACSIPLAILGNVTRVISICLVAAWCDPKFALGFYHDYSGYVVFIVAISLMVACGEAITRIWEKVESTLKKETPASNEETAEVEAASVRPAEEGPTFTGRVLPWVAVALLCPLFVLQAITPESTLAEAPVVELPMNLAGYEADEVRYCQNEQCSTMCALGELPEGKKTVCPRCGGALEEASLGERTILPADTVVKKRIYRSPHGDTYLVSAVIGGKSKSSIHRPELCMPAQGFLMQNPQDFILGESRRPYHAVQLGRPHAEPSTLVYTFVNQKGQRTASHVNRILIDTWDRSVHNRIDRWVMFTVLAQNGNSLRGFSRAYESDRQMMDRFLMSLMEKLP